MGEGYTAVQRHVKERFERLARTEAVGSWGSTLRALR
jgi:hypothetical protein